MRRCWIATAPGAPRNDGGEDARGARLKAVIARPQAVAIQLRRWVMARRWWWIRCCWIATAPAAPRNDGGEDARGARLKAVIARPQAVAIQLRRWVVGTAVVVDAPLLDCRVGLRPPRNDGGEDARGAGLKAVIARPQAVAIQWRRRVRTQRPTQLAAA